VPAAQLLPTPSFPSAVCLARLAVWPQAFDAQALFALEPHYLRGSGAEENPKFPPLPGLEARARLKED
jgi:tRNA threonylcarbamoyladenosine biosynthesis protein TsaB